MHQTSDTIQYTENAGNYFNFNILFDELFKLFLMQYTLALVFIKYVNKLYYNDAYIHIKMSIFQKETVFSSSLDKAIFY